MPLQSSVNTINTICKTFLTSNSEYAGAVCKLKSFCKERYQTTWKVPFLVFLQFFSLQTRLRPFANSAPLARP